MRGTAPVWQPRRFLYDWYFTTRGLEFWRRARPDILRALEGSDDVVLYSYWLYVTALEAVLLRRELGRRVTLAVSRAHRYDVITSASPLHFLPQRRLLVSGLDRVHPVSESGVHDLVDDVPDLADRVSLRRLGVCAPLGTGPRSNRPALEVVSCSSLKHVKRVPLLVDALAELSSREVPVRWTHFGGDGAELEALRTHASSALPAGSFALMGHVPNAAVLEHYAHSPASVFVNVSESEGVPVSVMEAMAHGIPALATRAGDTDRLVTHDRDGWLLPVEVDAAAVADAMEAVWRLSPSEYSAYSTAAHETWAADWEATVLYRDFAEELTLSGS
jgi:glycosyltransferase involved in cell wall biosynthesis